MAALKHEIAQERPFSSAEEEAFLNLMRTTDCLQRAFQRKTRDWGVTSTQYNVLRILRGAQPHGLTCSSIGDRMITAEPDITRLLSRMKALKLIKQQRDKNDRRVVWMDPEIMQAPKDLLGHLDRKDLAELTRLLELARRSCMNPQAPVSCTGERCETSAAAGVSH